MLNIFEIFIQSENLKPRKGGIFVARGIAPGKRIKKICAKHYVDVSKKLHGTRAINRNQVSIIYFYRIFI